MVLAVPIKKTRSRAKRSGSTLPKLGKSHMVKVESVSDEGTEIFWYLKPGWARPDGAHHVSYEPGRMEWSDVLAEFNSLKMCECRDCIELHQQI